MSFCRPLVLTVFAALMALLIGCSGGGPTSPIAKQGDVDSVPLFGLTEAGDASNAIGLLGAYELTINPDDLSAELTAKRMTSALGDSFLISGMGFFAVAPCGNCFTLSGVQRTTEGYLMVSFDVEHPFLPGDPGSPPTAVNRLDLDIFDVAVVVYPTSAPDTDFDLVSLYAEPCVQTDGYTKELRTLTMDNTALPFFLAVDDSDTGTTTYNELPMGGIATVDMFFDLTADLRFDMYLTFGYGASAVGKAQRLTPLYFNPEFNRKNAWKVIVVPPQGDDPPEMDNTWDNKDFTTAYTVTVKVWDWQQGNTNIASPPVNPTDIAAASNVVSVELEMPGMIDTTLEMTSPTSGTGTPSDPLIYEFLVANENGLPMGEYLCCVKVSDERIPPTSIGGFDFLIDSPNGIDLNNYTIPEFVTYQVFTATVVNRCGPITGSITAPATCPVTGKYAGQNVDFVVTASSANDGDPIVKYYVDFTNNGSFDAENTTGVFDNVPCMNSGCPGGPMVTQTVAFWAEDSCIPPNITKFATCDVEVSCPPPCTDQSLSYDFAGCSTPVLYTCQGWQAGGCGLPNTDDDWWSEFSWGCSIGTPLCTGVIIHPYITSGGDVGSCSWLYDVSDNANLNVVSPNITLPGSVNGVFEFDTCLSIPPGGYFRAYISTSGCAGPWTQIYQATPANNGCVENTQLDLSDYSSATTIFRFQLTNPTYSSFTGVCVGTQGSTGAIIDNVRVFGCFQGPLS